MLKTRSPATSNGVCCILFYFLFSVGLHVPTKVSSFVFSTARIRVKAPVSHPAFIGNRDSGITVSASSNNNEQSTTTKWTVYVDQSKPALDKGAAATLDAFTCLVAQPLSTVTVHGAILRKSKAKAPAVRCVGTNDNGDVITALDVGNVNAVDKVVRILRRHLQQTSVRSDVAACLSYKYQGTAHLEAGRVDRALTCYDRAIATGTTPQEGVLRLLRATAYLQRAAEARRELQTTVGDLTDMVVHTDALQTMWGTAAEESRLAPSLLRRVLQETGRHEAQFRHTQYRHGLYQYALLQAAQDSLKATQLLPDYPDAWQRAAEILAELWKLRESAQYYERAVELSDSQETKTNSTELNTIMEQLQGRQELLDNARAYGWSEDTLRLALDVAR